MSNKPLRFGEEAAADDIPRQTAALGDPGYHIDVNYIPGYTEHVMSNDMENAIQTDSTGMSGKTKREYFKRFGVAPSPLPFHFVPVRVLNAANEPLQGNQQLMNYQRLGYSPAKEADFREDGIFGRLGWKQPPAFVITADNRYRNWDTELWYVDGDRHRHNLRLKDQEDKALAFSDKMPDHFSSANGKAPTFELEPKRYTKTLEKTKE